MIPSHPKVRHSKDESLCNTSKVSSSSNINSLKKLLESNFKLSNPFKSKQKNVIDIAVNGNTECIAGTAPTGNKPFRRYENSSSNCKENRYLAPKNVQSKTDSEKGNYLNCNIPNCCCKTFFREYNNTPFRYRHIPKTPLKERSSEFNRIAVIRNSGTSERSVGFRKDGELESKNKFYNINYQFYKPKNIGLTLNQLDGTLKEPLDCTVDSRSSSVSYVKFNSDVGSEKRSSSVLPKIDDSFDEDSLNVDNKSEAEEEKLLEKSSIADNFIGNYINEEGNDIRKVGNFNLKYRVPKFKNLAIREHSHPYVLKKPRLTVKSVKNRNMRNVRRRQKMLDKSINRSQTFNGYDNFAYRRSITELNLPKNVKNQGNEPEQRPVVENEPEIKEPVSNNKFLADNRMASYNWPVTSFYIDKRDEGGNEKYASTSNLSYKSDSKANFMLKKSNLKRHCSLGYLQEELYECNFTRRRRSLDNVNSEFDILSNYTVFERCIVFIGVQKYMKYFVIFTYMLFFR